VADQAKLNGCKGRDIVTDAEILRNLSDVSSQQLKAGMLTRERLGTLRFQIDDYELLAGRISSCKHTQEEIIKADKFLKTIPSSGGQSGHCALYLEELFDIGIGGLINKISTLMTESEGERSKTYQSFIYALQGLQQMIANAVKPVEDALVSASKERSCELEKIIESCRRIENEPPEKFRDAIQLVWFLVIGTMVGDSIGYVCPGMLDRHFARFIEKSRNFKDEALEIVEAYYFLINDFTPSGGASAIMIGGIDGDGNDVTNELSYLSLEALRRTDLVYPTVGICWHENIPDNLINSALELISKGYTTPAFFGDKVIRQGLMQYGVPESEACDYQNSTCVEITPYGASNVWVASPYFSLCGILMEKIAENAEYVSYNDFIADYFNLLGKKIAQAVRCQNELRERRRCYNRNPLQSVFTNDCIANGRDIDDGGARYNWVECSFVGLANLVDSLKVIKEEVYSSGEYTLSELKEILDSDFADNESLRQKFLNLHSKYGLNDSSVDSEIIRLMDFITTECSKYKMLPDDSHFIPGNSGRTEGWHTLCRWCGTCSGT